MQQNTTYNHIVAGIYYACTLQGATMQEVVVVLERLRVELHTAKHDFQCLNKLDNAVVRAKNTNALAVLLEQREAWKSEIINKTVSEIEQIQVLNETTLEPIFLRFLCSWRTLFFKQVLEKRKATMDAEVFNYWQEKIKLIYERRWVELIPDFLRWKNNQQLSTEERAHLHGALAAIYLYYIGDLVKAEEVINEGKQLDASQAYLQHISAAFLLEKNNIAEAKEAYRNLYARDGTLLEGLNGLAACFKKEEDFFTAEEWYMRAINEAPGVLETYQNVISLYGLQKNLYEQRKEKLAEFVETEILIEPLYTYEYYTDAAYACFSALDFNTAEQWNTKAIHLEPNRYDAYWLQGDLFKAKMNDENKTNYFTQAEESYLKAITCAPSNFNSYWSLYILYKLEGDYPKALNILQKAKPYSSNFEKLLQDEFEICSEEIIRGKLSCELPNLNYNHSEIYIDCSEKLCKAILTEDFKALKPDFLQRLQAFKEEFNNQFGVQLPAILFRQFLATGYDYDFFVTLNETRAIPGYLFHDDMLLVSAKEKLELGTIANHQDHSFQFLYWINTEEENKLPNYAVRLANWDIIFQHLQLLLWRNVSNYITTENTAFIASTKDLPSEEKIYFLRFLRLLLTYKIPITNQEFLLQLLKEKRKENRCMQEILFDVMETEQGKISLPFAYSNFSVYQLHAVQEKKSSSWLTTTEHGEWAISVHPEECQLFLTALRNLNTETAYIIVSNKQLAFSLNLIAHIEFPLFFFITEKALRHWLPTYSSTFQPIAW